jgi:4-hydroxyproline epimerase
MTARLEHLKANLDHLRRGVVLEPRGSEAMVAAILTEPVAEGSVAGVVFCNNAGYLGMCGHGSIGVIETLRYLAQVQPGVVRLDTPVGTISAELDPGGEIGITNVESYRFAKDVPIEVPGIGELKGDVAYGGNWFFIVEQSPIELSLSALPALTALALQIRQTLFANQITGVGGTEIDHIELSGPPTSSRADSKNFVLCPGGAYDRSPCGTGTSAKVACLVADGKLGFGDEYIQESITGSAFRAVARPGRVGIIPTIWGRAYVTTESVLVFDENDPLRWGIS